MIGKDFCMSREEWKRHKKFTEKKRLSKVQQLRSYLHEKSELGLALKGYEDGSFIFEEDTQRYNYFVDTKRCLKKRLKKDGLRFTDDEKDWMTQSLKWYEMSIANAENYGLKPVAVIDKNVLVYKRAYSDENLPWENGNESINFAMPSVAAVIIAICSLALGLLIGILGVSFLL